MYEMDNTLATNCFNEIYQLILTGELLPGEKLKGEFLKQQLNVGLSPIREALFRLMGTGFVEFQDKAGFKVAGIDENKIRDIFETHAKIECLMLSESIRHGDDQWEANITSALYKLAKIEKNNITTDYNLWSSRNNDFHDALVSGCNIHGLSKIRINCLQIKEWYTNLANKTQPPIITGHDEHAKLAKLAIDRNSELACHTLYIHITKVVNSLVKQLKISTI